MFNDRKYNVPIFLNVDEVEEGLMIVDTRGGDDFKKSHLPGSINIMATSPKQKFETWLGAIIQPEEYYYLVVLYGPRHLKMLASHSVRHMGVESITPVNILVGLVGNLLACQFGQKMKKFLLLALPFFVLYTKEKRVECSRHSGAASFIIKALGKTGLAAKGHLRK